MKRLLCLVLLLSSPIIATEKKGPTLSDRLEEFKECQSRELKRIEMKVDAIQDCLLLEDDLEPIQLKLDRILFLLENSYFIKM